MGLREERNKKQHREREGRKKTRQHGLGERAGGKTQSRKEKFKGDRYLSSCDRRNAKERERKDATSMEREETSSSHLFFFRPISLSI